MAGPSQRYSASTVAAMFETMDFPEDIDSSSSEEDDFDLSDPEAVSGGPLLDLSSENDGLSVPPSPDVIQDTPPGSPELFSSPPPSQQDLPQRYSILFIFLCIVIEK